MALFCDATFVSAAAKKATMRGAHAAYGVAVARARCRNEARYPELARGGQQGPGMLAARVGAVVCRISTTYAQARSLASQGGPNGTAASCSPGPRAGSWHAGGGASWASRSSELSTVLPRGRGQRCSHPATLARLWQTFSTSRQTRRPAGFPSPTCHVGSDGLDCWKVLKKITVSTDDICAQSRTAILNCGDKRLEIWGYSDLWAAPQPPQRRLTLMNGADPGAAGADGRNDFELHTAQLRLSLCKQQTPKLNTRNLKPEK